MGFLTQGLMPLSLEAPLYAAKKISHGVRVQVVIQFCGHLSLGHDYEASPRLGYLLYVLEDSGGAKYSVDEYYLRLSRRLLPKGRLHCLPIFL